MPGINPEKAFGPTNINGVSGNGRLAAAFSRDGELTVLRWPSPSYFDHVSYLTRDYYAPRMGAAPNDGSSAAIAWSADGVSGVSWLYDPQWAHIQYYWSDDVSILVTLMVNAELGLTVVQTDFVRPYDDVLVRRYDIVRDPSSMVQRASLIYFENFNPCRDKVPYFPVIDWVLDDLNDFAVAYTSEYDALIHFRPQNPDDSLLRPYLGESQPVIDGVVSMLDEIFPLDAGEEYPPIYIAIGGDVPTSAHQCGVEDKTEGMDADAYWDLADGRLSNNSMAIGLTTGALQWDLPENLDTASITVFVALASSAKEALSMVREAAQLGYEYLFDECRSEWESWLGDALLPDTDDEGIVATCKRTLQALRIGTDAETGCMVASISTQPPYYVDWPRDGAFFNYALDLAGYHDMVTAHNLFYASVARSIVGSFEMNYYPDGMVGGPLFMEIDADGIITWEMWNHAQFLEGEERAAYLEAVYPTIRESADFMVRWRDEKTGLPLPTFEMDSPVPVQGLAGALGVYHGLRAAIEAGTEMGESEERLNRWRARLEELREAIIREFWDEERGTFRQGGFGAVYALFPEPFFPEGDPRNESHARALWEDLEPHVKKEVEWGAYSWMNLIALIPLWKDDPAKRPLLEEALRVMLTELPTRDTHHYGEGYAIVDTGQGREFENHVAMPHLGAHAQNFIAAMLFYGPAQPEEDGESDEEGGDGEGCGC